MTGQPYRSTCAVHDSCDFSPQTKITIIINMHQMNEEKSYSLFSLHIMELDM